MVRGADVATAFDAYALMLLSHADACRRCRHGHDAARHARVYATLRRHDYVIYAAPAITMLQDAAYVIIDTLRARYYAFDRCHATPLMLTPLFATRHATRL